MDKRDFIRLSVIGLGSLFTMPLLGKGRLSNGLLSSKNFELKIPDLPYSPGDLEPFIDAETMKYHLKHHEFYIENLKKAVDREGLYGKSIREILTKASKHSKDIRNNGGGYINHNMFWRILSPNGGGAPKGKLLTGIINKFGSFESFQKEFSEKALNTSGSEWIWLVLTENKDLRITKTQNQDSPIMDTTDVNGRPLILLDMWEHAYYLKYKDSKEEYISNFWKVIDWKFIEKKYERLLKIK